MRKKLFAILMSAMMMVTFMPAMAFAAVPADKVDFAYTVGGSTVTASFGGQSVEVKVDAKFNVGTTTKTEKVKHDVGNLTQYVKDSNGNFVQAKQQDWQKDHYVYVNAQFLVVNNGKYEVEETTTTDDTANAGKVQVEANMTDLAAKLDASEKYDAPVKFNEHTTGYTYAQLFTDELKTWHKEYYDLTGATFMVGSATVKDEYQHGGFDATTINGIKLVEPAALVKSGATAKTAALGTSFGGWSMEVVATGFDATSFDEQTVTLTTSFTANSEDAVQIVNAPLTKTVKVLAGEATSDKASFTLDGTTIDVSTQPYCYGAEDNKVEFDGKTHTIAMKEAKGLSVQYFKFNEKTAGWDEQAISFKNVADKGTYKAVVTDTKKSVDTYTFKVYMKPATLAFTAADPLKADLDVYEGETVDPYKYIATGANATAAKNDAETLSALTKELYTATVADVAHTNKKAVTVKANKFTGPEWTALEKKYANYKFNAPADFGSDITLEVLPSKANKVEIYNMTKTLKAKALKKAKKSFAINAEADSDTAITFKKVAGSSKLSVKDAKVVVKKGTKKGTYSIKVKATAAAGNGYAKATVTKTLKVKVK